jgi:N-acetylglucosamine-6-phosphate deacetylase
VSGMLHIAQTIDGLYEKCWACFAMQVDKVRNCVCQYGCTSFLATIITSAPSTYLQCIPQLQPRCGGGDGAHLLGIHLEGPFIAQKMKGAHPLQYVRTPDLSQTGLDALRAVYGSLDGVALVTLAPELPGSLDLISALVEVPSAAVCAHTADVPASGVTSAGSDHVAVSSLQFAVAPLPRVVVSAGHSMATYDQGVEALQRGCTLLTHLFNQMTPFHHRDPGMHQCVPLRERERERECVCVCVCVNGREREKSDCKLLSLGTNRLSVSERVR